MSERFDVFVAHDPADAETVAALRGRAGAGRASRRDARRQARSGGAGARRRAQRPVARRGRSSAERHADPVARAAPDGRGRGGGTADKASLARRRARCDDDRRARWRGARREVAGGAGPNDEARRRSMSSTPLRPISLSHPAHPTDYSPPVSHPGRCHPPITRARRILRRSASRPRAETRARVGRPGPHGDHARRAITSRPRPLARTVHELAT